MDYSKKVDIVVELFNNGFEHKEILNLLEKDGVKISLNSLKRILYNLNLKRKNVEESDIEDICSVILEELNTAGYNLGYRALWKKLKKKYYLNVKRDTVYDLMQIIDPDGLANRYAHRLRRREYVSPGPNFIWHLDGYDKLKPYGFAVHGCIDGFSRYLLWLEVANTNNDPKVTAHYFLKTVKSLKCVPSIIRSDKGTENTIIESLQIGLRTYHDDNLSGKRSYVKGKSVHNQRIESYWGQLRKHSADFFINFFKCMIQQNLLSGSQLEKKCLQYAFGPLIQKEINLSRELWNEHRIRKQHNEHNVAGKPHIMYNLPNKYNTVDYKKSIHEPTVDELLEKVTIKPVLVDPDFKKAVEEKMSFPAVNNADEALGVYMNLIRLFDVNNDSS